MGYVYSDFIEVLSFIIYEPRFLSLSLNRVNCDKKQLEINDERN